MKAKLYIIIFSLLTSFTCAAQSEGLLIDKPGKDGQRTIGTYFHYIRKGFTDTAPVGLSIIADISPEEIKFYLSVKMSNVTFPKGGVFLIKTSEDEVIELSQLSDKHETKSTHYIPNMGFIQQGTGIYPVTQDILNTLNQDGIAKIRIETSAEVIDREYKEKTTEKYKKEFTAMYSLILNTISEKKDIYSGF